MTIYENASSAEFYTKLIYMSTSLRTAIFSSISTIYALLYIYAAASKLLAYHDFEIQLGQSPLLSAFASWVAVAVPIAELVIAILLLLPQYRFAGLFLAYALMSMFTAYIFIITHYSAFVPCSCGGILEKMNWDQHLVFNIAFMAAAIAALLLHRKENSYEQQIALP